MLYKFYIFEIYDICRIIPVPPKKEAKNKGLLETSKSNNALDKIDTPSSSKSNNSLDEIDTPTSSKHYNLPLSRPLCLIVFTLCV
jgi:hypothetical protein